MSCGYGFDENWKRDIGYGVPSYCDHPECNRFIHRGLSFVCGSEPYDGEHGCGLYFCEEHRPVYYQHEDEIFMICDNCAEGKDPHEPSPEHPMWMGHKLTHESWSDWRSENKLLCFSMACSVAIYEIKTFLKSIWRKET